MDLFWYWWMAAAVLLLLELLSTHFLALMLALDAGLMGLLLYFYPHLAPAWQALIFSLLLLPNLVAWLQMVRRWRQRENGEAARLNQRALNYVGKRFLLREALHHHRGRLQIGDTFWRIESETAELAAGTEVEIEALDEDVFRVRPVSAARNGSL